MRFGIPFHIKCLKGLPISAIQKCPNICCPLRPALSAKTTITTTNNLFEDLLVSDPLLGRSVFPFKNQSHEIRLF